MKTLITLVIISLFLYACNDSGTVEDMIQKDRPHKVDTIKIKKY